MNRIFVLGTLVIAGALTVAVAAQQPAAPPPTPSLDGLTVEQVKDNLWIIRGAGGNVAVFATATGVTLVDSKNPGWGQVLLDKVKTLTDKPVTMVINTHLHYDHVSGNVSMPATTEIVAHAYTAKNIAAPGPIAGSTTPPQNVFKENPGKGIPKRTFTDRLTIGSGADRIDLYHFGPAHTGGDAFVAFPAHRIMHVGDTYPNNGLPIMDPGNGGSGVEYANTIRKAVKGVPDIDAIINGHTAANTTPADMLRFADFVSEFVAYVQAGKKAGTSAEQLVKEWKTPVAYKGFADPPVIERLTSYVKLIFEETK